MILRTFSASPKACPCDQQAVIPSRYIFGTVMPYLPARQISMRAPDHGQCAPVAILSHALDPHLWIDCGFEASGGGERVTSDACSAPCAMPEKLGRIDTQQSDPLALTVQRVAIHDATIADAISCQCHRHEQRDHPLLPTVFD
ncbi:MAG: hypothetical protein ABIS51_08690 [Sphingomonas sp.]